jgi:hypothetical protein
MLSSQAMTCQRNLDIIRSSLTTLKSVARLAAANRMAFCSGECLVELSQQRGSIMYCIVLFQTVVTIGKNKGADTPTGGVVF